MIYIGDGVYVDNEGEDVVLMTSDGIAVTNRIVLEPAVLATLLALLEAKAPEEDLREDALTDTERNPEINDARHG